MCPSGRISTTKAGFPNFRQAFDILDTDRDGKISTNDLQTFYSGFSGKKITSDEDISSMISIADLNKDGFVEFDEFEKVLGFCSKDLPVHGVMKDVFNVMDKDADGKVGFEDLKNYMNWAGFSANDEDIKAMIRLGGCDEKVGLCYEDFAKILAVDFA